MSSIISTRVGELYRERIYVPQGKCRKVPDGIDGSKEKRIDD